MRTIRKAVLTALAVAACGGVSAQTARVALDIKPQPMRAALKALGEQAGLQILFRAEDVAAGGAAPAVIGQLSIEDALERLLTSSGLRYEFVNERTVRIAAKQPVSTSSVMSGSALGQEDDSWSRFLLAQSDSSPSSSITSSDGEGTAGQAAKEGRGESERLEEVIVTAQKRKEVLQDVPISITVLSGRDLDRATGEGVLDALNRVSGVSMQGISIGGMSQLAVRGVSAGEGVATGSSPVAYYLDSVPFSFARHAMVPDINPYDLERVEVLRGPQGTLYGAGSLNGVVRVLTHKAELNRFEFKTRLSTSSTDGGEQSYRGDVAINVPLIDDKLAVRAVMGYQELGGWVETRYAADANDARLRSGRLKLKYQPTEALSIDVSAWHSSADRETPDVADDTGFHGATRSEPIKIELDVYSIDISYDLPAFSISSSSSYLDQTHESAIDLGGLAFGFLNDSLSTDLPIEVFSQEIYFRSNGEGPWRWSFGGMYRDEEEHLYQIRTDNTTGAICCFYVAPTDYITASKSSAVFGEMTRLFLNGRLELTGGLRYFKDDESADELSRNTGAPASELVHPRSSFHAVSPRAVLTWHAREQVTMYASYSEGFRSGLDQLNSVLAAVPQFGPVDADTLKNYEVGTKGDLWNGKLGFELAAYFIDWQDVQQSLGVEVSGLSQLGVVNSGSASGMGFDFAVNAELLTGLQVGATFSWNDLTFDDDVITYGSFRYASEGERLNHSPKSMIGGFVDYSFPLINGFSSRISMSANHISEKLLRVAPSGADATAVKGDSMLIGRTSISLEAPERWTATLFADNVTNEDGAALPDSNLSFRPRIRPRTIGVQFEYRFGRQ